MSAATPAHEKVLVLDFGSQTSQLIARRVRDLSVCGELVPCTIPYEKVLEAAPKGLILSGGPDSEARWPVGRAGNSVAPTSR